MFEGKRLDHLALQDKWILQDGKTRGIAVQGPRRVQGVVVRRSLMPRLMYTVQTYFQVLTFPDYGRNTKADDESNYDKRENTIRIN